MPRSDGQNLELGTWNLELGTWNSGTLKLHPGRLPRFRRGFEERFFSEPEHSRDQHGGKRFHRGVHLHDRVVVGLAGERNSIFRGGEFVLEGKEILIGFEVRVSLRDGQQPGKRAGQFTFSFDPIRGYRGTGRFRASVHHGFEGALFVRGISLNGVYQVGDEVMPALELNVNLRPRIPHTLAQPDQPVIGPYKPQPKEDNQPHQYQDCNQRPRHKSELAESGQDCNYYSWNPGIWNIRRTAA
jgi:hypothetical protein